MLMAEMHIGIVRVGVLHRFVHMDVRVWFPALLAF
jgi:hypothetical protein